MRSSFEEALSAIFGSVTSPAVAVSEASERPDSEVDTGADITEAVADGTVLYTVVQMVSAAQDRLRGAQTALREWDWSRAGEEFEALETALSELRQELEETVVTEQVLSSYQHEELESDILNFMDEKS